MKLGALCLLLPFGISAQTTTFAPTTAPTTVAAPTDPYSVCQAALDPSVMPSKMADRRTLCDDPGLQAAIDGSCQASDDAATCTVKQKASCYVTDYFRDPTVAVNMDCLYYQKNLCCDEANTSTDDVKRVMCELCQPVFDFVPSDDGTVATPPPETGSGDPTVDPFEGKTNYLTAFLGSDWNSCCLHDSTGATESFCFEHGRIDQLPTTYTDVSLTGTCKLTVYDYYDFVEWNTDSKRTYEKFGPLDTAPLLATGVASAVCDCSGGLEKVPPTDARVFVDENSFGAPPDTNEGDDLSRFVDGDVWTKWMPSAALDKIEATFQLPETNVLTGLTYCHYAGDFTNRAAKLALVAEDGTTVQEWTFDEYDWNTCQDLKLDAPKEIPAYAHTHVQLFARTDAYTGTYFQIAAGELTLYRQPLPPAQCCLFAEWNGREGQQCSQGWSVFNVGPQWNDRYTHVDVSPGCRATVYDSDGFQYGYVFSEGVSPLTFGATSMKCDCTAAGSTYRPKQFDTQYKDLATVVDAAPVGCFYDAPDRDFSFSVGDKYGPDAWNQCLNSCKAFGFQFMSMQYNTQCYCGNNYGEKGATGSPDECWMCEDGVHRCGGYWAESVYQILWDGTTYSGDQNPTSAPPTEEEDCAVGCPSFFIGDGYCDPSCNTVKCGFDKGDCEFRNENSCCFSSSLDPNDPNAVSLCSNGEDRDWVGWENNDMMQSMVVKGTCKATVFEHGGYGGLSAEYSAGTYSGINEAPGLFDPNSGAPWLSSFMCHCENVDFVPVPVIDDTTPLEGDMCCFYLDSSMDKNGDYVCSQGWLGWIGDRQNDRMRFADIAPTCKAVIYEHSGYGGAHWILGPGQFDDLAQPGLVPMSSLVCACGEYAWLPEQNSCDAKCTEELRNNGQCDEECNNPDCGYDNGQCNDVFNGGGTYTGGNKCTPECIGWMGDNYCDEQCNTVECSFDGGDCKRDANGPSDGSADNSFGFFSAQCANAYNEPAGQELQRAIQECEDNREQARLNCSMTQYINVTNSMGETQELRVPRTEMQINTCLDLAVTQCINQAPQMCSFFQAEGSNCCLKVGAASTSILDEAGDIEFYANQCGMCGVPTTETGESVSLYSAVPLGCWKDNYDRVLPRYAMDVWDTTLYNQCMNFCGSNGYAYFGLQYATQCFCGSDDFKRYGEAPKDECYPCSDGQNMCGGTWTMNVYSITKGKVVVAVEDMAALTGSTAVVDGRPVWSAEMTTEAVKESATTPEAAMEVDENSYDWLNSLCQAAKGTSAGIKADSGVNACTSTTKLASVTSLCSAATYTEKVVNGVTQKVKVTKSATQIAECVESKTADCLKAQLSGSVCKFVQSTQSCCLRAGAYDSPDGVAELENYRAACRACDVSIYPETPSDEVVSDGEAVGKDASATADSYEGLNAICEDAKATETGQLADTGLESCQTDDKQDSLRALCATPKSVTKTVNGTATTTTVTPTKAQIDKCLIQKTQECVNNHSNDICKFFRVNGACCLRAGIYDAPANNIELAHYKVACEACGVSVYATGEIDNVYTPPGSASGAVQVIASVLAVVAALAVF